MPSHNKLECLSLSVTSTLAIKGKKSTFKEVYLGKLQPCLNYKAKVKVTGNNKYSSLLRFGNRPEEDIHFVVI